MALSPSQLLTDDSYNDPVFSCPNDFLNKCVSSTPKLHQYQGQENNVSNCALTGYKDFPPSPKLNEQQGQGNNVSNHAVPGYTNTAGHTGNLSFIDQGHSGIARPINTILETVTQTTALGNNKTSDPILFSPFINQEHNIGTGNSSTLNQMQNLSSFNQVHIGMENIINDKAGNENTLNQTQNLSSVNEEDPETESIVNVSNKADCTLEQRNEAYASGLNVTGSSSTGNQVINYLFIDQGHSGIKQFTTDGIVTVSTNAAKQTENLPSSNHNNDTRATFNPQPDAGQNLKAVEVPHLRIGELYYPITVFTPVEQNQAQNTVVQTYAENPAIPGSVLDASANSSFASVSADTGNGNALAANSIADGISEGQSIILQVEEGNLTDLGPECGNINAIVASTYKNTDKNQCLGPKKTGRKKKEEIPLHTLNADDFPNKEDKTRIRKSKNAHKNRKEKEQKMKKLMMELEKFQAAGQEIM